MTLCVVKSSKQRGAIQLKIIFIGLGIVILLLIGFSYAKSKAQAERIQALQQKTQELNTANTQAQVADTNTSIANPVDTNQPKMAESAFVDLSQIREQVNQLTIAWARFQDAKPMLSDSSSKLVDGIANLQNIKSDFSRVNVDNCLSQPKSDIQQAMQLTIDAFSARLSGDKNDVNLLVEANTLIEKAYAKMNSCQN